MFGLNVDLNEQNIVMDLNNVILNDTIHPIWMPPLNHVYKCTWLFVVEKTSSKNTGIGKYDDVGLQQVSM